MKRKAFLIVALLLIAAIVPLIVIRAQAALSAGPDQEVYTGETTIFNGTTTENVTSIIQVTWDFGDNTTAINGTSPDLLNATHVYTTAGVYNATLTVKFDSTLNKTETATAIITVSENTPPIADAGPDQTVEQTSPQGAMVTLNGTGSSDSDNDTLTYYWNWTGGSATGATPTALFPLGNTTVTLTATDGQYNATDAVNIIVQADTTAPVVDAGPDVNVEQESHEGTEVILNGTATNTVSTRFNFTWSENGMVLKDEANVTDTTLIYTFNLGTHIVTLNATDMAGNTASGNVTVTVIDTTPPEINATATPSALWPPNHKYVEVKINVSVYDICDPSPTLTFVSITSNEPGNSVGDGNTANDIVIVNDFTFNLRAERSGTGSGRTYTITYQATDISGNTAMASVTIEVPHNQ
jgi:PKD repeat protein